MKDSGNLSYDAESGRFTQPQVEAYSAWAMGGIIADWHWYGPWCRHGHGLRYGLRHNAGDCYISPCHGHGHAAVDHRIGLWHWHVHVDMGKDTGMCTVSEVSSMTSSRSMPCTLTYGRSMASESPHWPPAAAGLGLWPWAWAAHERSVSWPLTEAELRSSPCQLLAWALGSRLSCQPLMWALGWRLSCQQLAWSLGWMSPFQPRDRALQWRLICLPLEGTLQWKSSSQSLARLRRLLACHTVSDFPGASIKRQSVVRLWWTFPLHRCKCSNQYF